jgi:hypothetical protein
MGKEDFADSVPPLLNTPRFLMAWGEWVQDRRDRRLTLTRRAAQMQLGKLEGLSESAAIRAIHEAIENGWRTFFPKSERRESSDVLDARQREEKRLASERASARQNEVNDRQKRIDFVAALKPDVRQRIHDKLVSEAPEKFRTSMRKADPLGGHGLTNLIYAAAKAEQMSKEEA